MYMSAGGEGETAREIWPLPQDPPGKNAKFRAGARMGSSG
ncbi:hypothetical protein chiPu_0024261, partial [Chiloscyllium punctatum]|nr:hypothetical protein [Chiloscyllium punctatum]